METVAGPPAKWAVSIVDWAGPANGGGGGSGAGAGGGGGASQVTENLGVLACGAALCLEIEAQDAHQNRWGCSRTGCFARDVSSPHVRSSLSCRCVPPAFKFARFPEHHKASPIDVWSPARAQHAVYGLRKALPGWVCSPAYARSPRSTTSLHTAITSTLFLPQVLSVEWLGTATHAVGGATWRGGRRAAVRHRQLGVRLGHVAGTAACQSHLGS